MKTLKRFSAAVLAMLMLLCFAGCNGTSEDETTTEAPETTSYIREVKTKIAAFDGAGGLSLAKLKADRDYAYEVEYYSDPQEIADLLKKGEADIATLPVNFAASLYKETNGGIQMLSINTLGNLYILENGSSIQSISDLKGKTIYAAGSEHILNYILTQNGIDPEKDVNIEYKTDSDELEALAVEGEADICVLPEPFASKAVKANADMRRAIDLNAEWDKVCDTQLAQGVVVARTEYIKQNPEYIEKFMTHSEVSLNYTKDIPEAGAIFLYENEYFDDVEIAKEFILGSNLLFVSGENMKIMAKAVFEILYQADPASVGGAVPDDGIYYGA